MRTAFLKQKGKERQLERLWGVLIMAFFQAGLPSFGSDWQQSALFQET